ncbi:MAG: protein tyrosine phosphatase family protein [Pseudomonadales bacterium]
MSTPTTAASSAQKLRILIPRLGTAEWLMLCALCTLSGHAQSAPASDIVNWRSYSESFASSGQPDAAQLETLSQQGYQRIIYIAFSDHENSLAGEDRLVKKLGMQYIHIPVIWNAPTAADFAAFASTMQAHPNQKTLLHCQVNYRASAFALLYRVIYQQVPLAAAKSAMDSVWTPDATWMRFIQEVLVDHDIDPNCSGCDWTPRQG